MLINLQWKIKLNNLLIILKNIFDKFYKNHFLILFIIDLIIDNKYNPYKGTYKPILKLYYCTNIQIRRNFIYDNLTIYLYHLNFNINLKSIDYLIN